ncbi:MAG: site-specific integrase, partial [Candidatus Omnitrophota bacterium]
ITRAIHMEQYKHSSNGSAGLSFTELKNRLELKLKADNVSSRTIYHNLLPKYRSLFETFIPMRYPQVTTINQLTKALIENYKQWIVVERGRTTGWRDELTKIKTMVKKLVDIGCCNKEIYYDVLGSFKRPPRHKKLYKEISREDMKKLLDYIKQDRPDLYGPTYFIMRLGWRRGQVLSIKRKNIRWNALWPVEILIEPSDTKTKEPFILRDIDPELANVIKRYAFDKRKTIWLFPNKNNNIHHANHYTKYISKISKNVLGIALSPHDFRHSFVTTRLKEGSTPRDIMAITGHKDVESFNIYTHPTSEGTKKVIENSRLLT